MDLQRKRRGSFTDLFPPEYVNLTWSIENSFLFYGYYYEHQVLLGERGFEYHFDAVYGLAVILVACTSLLIMVRNIGKGLTVILIFQRNAMIVPIYYEAEGEVG